MSPEAKALLALAVASAVVIRPPPRWPGSRAGPGSSTTPAATSSMRGPRPTSAGSRSCSACGRALPLAGAGSPLPAIVAGAVLICLLGTVDDYRPLPKWVRVAGQAASRPASGRSAPDGRRRSAMDGPAVDDRLGGPAVERLQPLRQPRRRGDQRRRRIRPRGGRDRAVRRWVVATRGPGRRRLLGACIAFLRFNLARPARIFLGDGGANLIGFVIAATAMTASGRRASVTVYFAAALLIAVPLLDTAMVSISRSRRGTPILAGGRDHLTHRGQVASDHRARVAAAACGGAGARWPRSSVLAADRAGRDRHRGRRPPSPRPRRHRAWIAMWRPELEFADFSADALAKRAPSRAGVSSQTTTKRGSRGKTENVSTGQRVDTVVNGLRIDDREVIEIAPTATSSPRSATTTRARSSRRASCSDGGRVRRSTR